MMSEELCPLTMVTTSPRSSLCFALFSRICANAALLKIFHLRPCLEVSGSENTFMNSSGQDNMLSMEFVTRDSMALSG